MATPAVKIVPIICYIATVYAANWALKEFGFVHVGFGMMVPAGVFFAGLAFSFRDLTHEAVGRWGCIAAILVGSALSYVLEDVGSIALASAVAFIVSELMDLAVYEPLRKRSWLGAVAASNTVGLVTDSVLFLWIAFGGLTGLEGLILGKAYMTVLAIVLLGLWRQSRALPERRRAS